MRLPKRRHQMLETYDTKDDSHYLTVEALARLKRTLYELEVVQRPKVTEDVTRARALGDLSENAEYQDAKSRMTRMDGRIFSLKERIKHAIPIEKGAGKDGSVQVGSTVVVLMAGKEKTYQILGSQESNPSLGRISHLSPLGKALLGAKAGEIVSVPAPNGKTDCEIVSVS